MLLFVDFLSFQISARGVQPISRKIQAIQDVPVPADVTQLKSFLGLVNYYSNILHDLSHVLEVKSLLTSQCLLVHSEPTRDLILAHDALPYCVIAVLVHRFSDGPENI